MENTIYNIRRDTGAWRMQVWISFGIAVLICGSGLAWLPGADLDRAVMVMGYFFCLSAAFALSKYVRDKAIVDTDTPMWGMVVWGGFALAMATSSRTFLTGSDTFETMTNGDSPVCATIVKSRSES